MSEFEEKMEKILKAQDKLLRQIEELNQRFDRQEQRLAPFAEFVADAQSVAVNKGLSRNTIRENDNMDRFIEPDKKRLLVSINSIPVLKHRKRR